MNALLDTFHNSGFSIVGFPCNQFGFQEPGANGTEILNALAFVRPGNGYQPHPHLHMMLKSDVNGPNELPLFTYLKTSCCQPDTAKFSPRRSFWEPILFNDIAWNFEKFLVSSNGVPIFRFRNLVEPNDLAEIISALVTSGNDTVTQKKELDSLLDSLDKVVQKREQESTC